MSGTLTSIGEFGLIDQIRRLIEKEGTCPPGVRLGIGDDAASFQGRAGYEILVTCDCIVEGRHYLPEHISAFDLGRRTMTLNISDIGAMGGRPLYALVSLGLKGGTEVSYIKDLYRGFLYELSPMGGAIIGGNLTKAVGASFIDITLIGEVEEGRATRRSAAQAGDAILVTGYPGESAAGLSLLLQKEPFEGLYDHPLVRRYTTPTHRAREGRAISLSGFATAMIDTSDGFSGDLGHICEGSCLGAELYEDKLPISEALKEAARKLKRDPVEMVLGESDDYELIITCLPENSERIRSIAAKASGVPIHEVGKMIVPTDGMRIRKTGGTLIPIEGRGWDHFMQKEE